MRVLQVIPNKNWALDKIMGLVKEGDGIEIKRHYMEEDGHTLNLSGVDIVEYGMWGNLPFEGKLVPTLITVHHIEPGHEEEAKARLKANNPDKIIVVNPITKKALKKIGFKSQVIPIATKKREFRVGYLGNNIPSKRFDMIDEACEELKHLGVVCWGQRRKGPEVPMTNEEIDEWYRSINVLVIADMKIVGSGTAVEAVACGTPVIAYKYTYHPHKDNVTWFDGSKEDLKKKIVAMMPKPLLIPEEYSNKYRKVYREIYENTHNW